MEYLKHLILNARREREQKRQAREAQENLLNFKKLLSETSKYFKEKEYFVDCEPNLRRLNSFLISFAGFPGTINLFELLQNRLQKDAIYNKGYWHFIDGYLSESDAGYIEFTQQATDLARTFCMALLKVPYFNSPEDVEDFVRFTMGVVEEILSNCEKSDYNMTSYQFGELVVLNRLYSSLNELLNEFETVRTLIQQL